MGYSYRKFYCLLFIGLAYNCNIENGDTDFELERNFTIRIRCVLAKRNAGLTCQLDGNVYKIVHCFGFLKMKVWLVDGVHPSYQYAGLVAMANTLPSGSVTEIRLPSSSFLFRTSLDFKVIFLDSRVTEVTGYSHIEMLDYSLYSFVHACDIEILKSAHETALSKRQSTSAYYRFLVKHGGWVWVQTHLSVVENVRATRPLCIVSVNHVISQTESCQCFVEERQIRLADDKESPISKSSSAGSAIGVYSEQFYGSNGCLLLQGNSEGLTEAQMRYFLK